MPTPVWQPGTPYPTGSLVQPLTPIAPVPTALSNPGFDAGNTSGWTFSGPGTYAVTTLNSQSGTYNLGLDNGVVEGLNAEFPANPGLSISASIFVRLSESGTSAGRVRLYWYDSSHVQIGAAVDGNLVQKPASQSERWVQSTLSAVAPLLTAYVKVGFWSESGVGGGDTRVDSLSWNYTSASAPSGLIFEATQVGLGISAGIEPVWPSAPGIPVNDGTVVWEGVIANRVVWEASPIMVSGATEPTWPEVVGESVTDGTVSWETVSLRVEDENCPNSKVVTIASSKVYAADDDIVRFSATVNPLDWTTPDDAGYLPSGLNQFGSNRTAVLNTYRGNLVSFSASTFQNWQVDPDPANMALLDAMEGIGSTWQQAAHPVANDLFYLAALGVRTVGISAGTSNLAAGDAGMPIDPLVQAAMTVSVRPLSTYLPSEGQYWLCMRPPLPEVIGPSISGEAPDGTAGNAYSQFDYTVTAGDAPIASVTIFSGTFIPGLGFDTTDGFIEAGIPTTAGTYTYTLEVLDENGIPAYHTDTVVIAPVELGLEWQYTGIFGNNMFDVCFGTTDANEDLFLACGAGIASNGEIWTSPNGDNWLQRTDGSSNALRSCAFGYVGDDPLFVVSRDSANVLTSPDCVTWTNHTTIDADAYLVTLYDGNAFIRAGLNNSAEYSSDAVTWTQQGRPSSNTATTGIAFEFGGDKVAMVFCTAGAIHRTTDSGDNWTNITVPADPAPAQNFGGAATDGTTIRAYKYASSILTTYTSIDGGVNWTWMQDNIGSSNYQAGPCLYRNGNWFGLGMTTTGGQQVQLWYSPDGLVPWTAAVVQDYDDTIAATMQAVAASDSRAVLIGNKAAEGYAMTSPVLTP
jgi:hypothetical protein